MPPRIKGHFRMLAHAPLLGSELSRRRRLLGGRAVGGPRALCKLRDERRHNRAEANRRHVRSDQPDLPHVEVRRPAEVRIAVAVYDPGETRARTGRERERANNARLDIVHPEGREVRVARPREHPQLRVEPHTVTARPTATRRPTASNTDDLAHPRMFPGQCSLAASG